MGSLMITSPSSEETYRTKRGEMLVVFVKGEATSTTTYRWDPDGTSFEDIEDLSFIEVSLGGSAKVVASISAPEELGGGVLRYTWDAVVSTHITGTANLEILAEAEFHNSNSGGGIGRPRPRPPKLNISSRRTIRALVDTTKPSIDAKFTENNQQTIELECPVPDASTGVAVRPVNISGAASDDLAGVARVAVAVGMNGTFGPFQDAVPSGSWASWTAQVNVRVSPGVHQILVRAWDGSDNVSELVLTATFIDRAGPTLTIEPPPPDASALIHDVDPVTFTVTGTALDLHTGVASVKVHLLDDDRALDSVAAVLKGPHGANQETSWSATLTARESGTFRIVAEATDHGLPANQTTVDKVLTIIGMQNPVVIIEHPLRDGFIGGSESGVSVEVRGTATAFHSKITLVEARLGNTAAWTRATPLKSDDWSKWKVDLLVPSVGKQTITVRATTDARNEDKRTGHAMVEINVSFSYTPQDTEDNISLLAYFRDLIAFAGRRVVVGEGAAAPRLSVTHLESAFFQPYGELTDDEPVQQVRICIEVLRAYLASMGKDVKDVARRYCQAAYHALLVQFGTSYDELRLSRGASPDERRRLADRLGIDLGEASSGGADPATPRSDRLDALLLTPDEVQEGRLEALFGLVDTSRDPLAVKDTPALFAWQMAHLRTRWRREDHSTSGGARPASPLLDPDVVGRDDIAEATEGKAVYELWVARRAWLHERRARLSADRLSGEDDRSRLERLVNGALAPKAFADLEALAGRERAGEDIADRVAELLLTRAAFNALLHFGGLAAHAQLIESEWSDVYDILVQVAKVKEYDRWRAEERDLILGATEVGLVIGPDHFVQAEAPPSSPRWRADPQERRAWEKALQARVAQQDAVIETYGVSLRAAETATLPMLRDALVATVDAKPGIDTANWLTQRLMIDVRSSGELRTTRMAQAVETLQSILLALRAGRFLEMDGGLGPVPADSWRLDVLGNTSAPIDQIFDLEYRWMGTYKNWCAAMRVFLYPENLLLPTLRGDTDKSLAFRSMLEELQSSTPVTPTAARGAAEKYLSIALRERGSALDELATKAWPMDAAPPDWKKKTLVLNEQIAEADLPGRAEAIERMLVTNGGKEPLQSDLAELFYWAPMQLGLELHRAGQYAAALDWFRTVYGYNLPAGARKVYYGLKEEETFTSAYQHTDQWLRTQLNPHDIAPMRAGAKTRFTMLSIVRCFLDYADAEFAEDSGESLARARTLYLAGLDLLASSDMRDPSADFGFRSNPEPLAARDHAQSNLFKLHSGRNIAGMQRWSQSDVPHGGSALEVRSFSGLKPTPYRYSVLIERAKQLVAIAQQMESAYLAALERHDAERYTLFKAGQHLGLAQASVRLQLSRVTEAAGGVSLANSQLERAEMLRDTYKKWLDEPLNYHEERMLAAQRAATTARNVVAGIDAMIARAEAVSGLNPQNPLSVFGAYAVSFLSMGRSAAQMVANESEGIAQESSFWADRERTRQGWTRDLNLAEKDVAIGDLQVVQAQDHLRVVMQEQQIAEMQLNHAEAEVDFLAHKFTSAELYAWMSSILGRVYSYFLQQAAAIARLAQAQLAFERQERPLSRIRADYWQAPAEDVQQASAGSRDRRGLTGSARLLQDIHQLDQYAFETNKRKLQLSKTISLAQIAPFELALFRQSGVLPFRTPMSLFDQDFPGHYLRLIRKVRTSVVALVPPSQGIRSTLENGGISRVTVGDAGFRDVVVRRAPELVALTSPANATGLFELDVQSDMMLPFENAGVDTEWLLQMPKAANPFNYDTIADVLFTVEYTALYSPDYRQQVIRRLDRTFSADRSFSLRGDFPDQWYDLINPPADGATPIRFDTMRGDFPPHLTDLRIEQVVLYFAGKDDKARGPEVEHLHLTPVDGGETIEGGAARAVGNVISTRRSSAGAWAALRGRSPAGAWQLKLSAGTLASLRDGAFDDILLVITFKGMTPPWPA